MITNYGFPNFVTQPPDPKFPLLKVLAIIALLLLVMSLCFSKARAQNMPMPAIVSVAQSQIGKGELWGNNRGFYVKQYLNGRENLPWCAGFVSYCAKKAGLNIRYTLRAKDFIKYGKSLKEYEIRPGDLVVFSRQGGGHVGIIIEIGELHFATIEGNVGKYPAKVKTFIHKYSEKSIVGFVRLAKAGK